MSSLYYRPSGNLPPIVALWALLMSTALLPIAWFYAWLDISGPAGVLTLLYAIAFGGCCGVASYNVAKRGKARNPSGMFLMGAGIGLVAWYGQWVAWLTIASDQPAVAAMLKDAAHTALDFATSPGRMYSLAHQIREGHLADASGKILVKSPDIAWILELLFLTVLPGLCGGGKALAPFCEVSGTWGGIAMLPKHHGFITSTAEFIKQLEADPRATLARVTSHPASTFGFSTITLTVCRPSGKAFLDVVNTEIIIKGGTENSKKQPIVSNLAIDLALADDLLRQSADGGPLPTGSFNAPNPTELQPAIDQLEAGEYETALALAAPHLNSDDVHLRTDAIRLSALACSRKDEWGAALAHWRGLFDHEASAHNAHQVATASVMAGNVAQGEVWMRTAVRLNETSDESSWLEITTNFITALKNSGNANLAMPYLNQVKAVYEKLYITDDTFLYLRGVPFFSSFLDNSRAVVTSALSHAEATQWYESMLPHIDQDGKTQLQAWLREGRPEFSQSPA